MTPFRTLKITMVMMVALFAIAVFGAPQTAAAACTITSADWYSNLGGATVGLRNAANPGLEMVIKSTGCNGLSGQLIIEEVDLISNDSTGAPFTFLFDATGTTRIPLVVGEKKCETGESGCVIKASVTAFLGAGQGYGPAFEAPYHLFYSCKNSSACDPNLEWKLGDTASLGDLATKSKANAPTTLCKVTGARFDPGLSLETSTLDMPAEGKVFYTDANRPTVTISITTQNCQNQQVFVSLRQKSSITGSFEGVANDFFELPYVVPASNQVTITATAGGKSCAPLEDPDCQYYLYVSPSQGTGNERAYFSKGKVNGRLAYNCNTAPCALQAWTIGADSSQKSIPNKVTVSGQAAVNSGDCLDKSTGKNIPGCYELYGELATALGNKINSIGTADSFGSFVNILITWVIGIGGVLTVVMIMYSGYLYAFARKVGDVSGVDHAKKRMFQSVLGLLVLLTMYTLLRTINPDLLNLNPRFDAVTIMVADGQDPQEAFEQAIAKDPKLAKVYASTKNHWRDGGPTNPSSEQAHRSLTDSVAASTLTDLTTLGVKVKAGAGKMLLSETAQKVAAFNTALRQEGIVMTVTEAFKPTIYTHFASCQYTGTCADGSMSFNANKVARMIALAQQNGLIVIWETKIPSQYDALLKEGVPASSMQLFKGHIIGDYHFSIYEYVP